MTAAVELGVGDNGSAISGAVAAFLFDITDNYLDTHEPYDNMSYAFSHLRRMMETCRVTYSDGTGRAR